jgi:hypothetical protein
VTPLAKETRPPLIKGEHTRCIRGHRPGQPAKIPDEQRLWAKVERLGPDDCWEYREGRNGNGYGLVTTDTGTRLAHRVAWEVTNGPIAEGMSVCHRCDNPPCCNPNHLFLGTHQENMADSKRKGRVRLPMLKGEAHPQARLDEDAVRAIRLGYALGGISHRRLGWIYGVSAETIGRIVRRETWKEVA